MTDRPLLPAALAGACALALYAAAVATYAGTGGDRYWATRLAALPAEPGPALVVAIGDSLLQFATLGPPEMEDLLAAATPGRRAQWVPLQREDLRAAEVRWLLDLALARRPALVVIQYEPLVNTRQDPAMGLWLPFVGSGHQVQWFRWWLQARLAGDEDVFEAELRRLDAHDCGAVAEDDRVVGDPTDSAHTGAYDSATRALLEQARARADVLVVDVPPSAGLGTWSAAARARWFPAVGRGPGLAAVRYPVAPPRAQTCDGTHYDLDARIAYSRWLARQVDEALRRGGRR